VREKEHGTLEHAAGQPAAAGRAVRRQDYSNRDRVLLLSPLSLYAIVHGVHGTPLPAVSCCSMPSPSLYVFSIASLGLTLAVIARNLHRR